MIGVWLLLIVVAGCAGFVAGHLHAASYWRVGPWDGSLDAMGRALEGERR